MDNRSEDKMPEWAKDVPGLARLRNAVLTPEGRILRMGVLFALLYLVFLSLCVLFAPDLAQAFIGITASNVLFGRAAGLSLGYALGFGHLVVMPLNMLIETILVLLFYPLFVLSIKHLMVSAWVRKLINRTLSSAERHHQKVRRYGIPGLLLFVWFPFTMTGPLVGCIIGYMIGLRPWVNMTVVLGGTYLAVICWALLLGSMLERAAGYSPYAPIIVVVVMLAAYVLVKILRARKARKIKNPPASE